MRWTGRLRQGRAAQGAGNIGCTAAAVLAVQGHPAARCILRAGAFRVAFYSDAPTGRTNQRFLVSVCRDQDQRFRRPVFLHSPTSHGRSFQAGMVARNWLTPPSANVRKNSGPRKASAHPPGKDPWIALSQPPHLQQCFSWRAPTSAEAQNRQVIQIEADREKDVYRFVPAKVTARAGRRPDFQGRPRLAPQHRVRRRRPE